jgi:ribose transport system permease protein
MAPPSARNRALDFLAENGFIVVFALWCLFLAIFTDNFLTPKNLMTVLRQSAAIGIVAIGEALVVLLAAGMDVSVASNLGLAGVLVALFMVKLNLPLALAVPLALAGSAVVGLVNGLLVTKIKINGVVVTLGMMFALEGVSLALAGGGTIGGVGSAMDRLAPLAQGWIGPVPVPVILLFLAYAVAHYLLNYTVLGAHAYAVGANEQASWLAGIKVERLRIIGYVAAGLLAGVGGVMQAGRMNSATGAMGAEFLFPVLTAVILAGVSLAGGRGKILHVLVAAIFMYTIQNGLTLFHVESQNVQKIIFGVLLVLALSLDRLRAGPR